MQKWRSWPGLGENVRSNRQAGLAPPAMLLRSRLLGAQRAAGMIRRAVLASRADALLVSYPKSGRTWLRFILANYFALMSGTATRIDLHTMFSFVPNFDFDPARGIPALNSEVGRGRVPLILATHTHHGNTVCWRRPIIFMVRDPRDLMVSAYFHATRQKRRFRGSISDFLQHPELGMPAFVRYLDGWAKSLARHPHLVVSYERLASKTEQSVAEVLGFVRCAGETDLLRRAIHLSRFSRMAEIERRQGIPGHEYDRGDPEALRMRKGQVGGYGEYLSQEEVDLIERWCNSALSAPARHLLDATGWRTR
ncbi:sulfotransferase domain-containing protein [Rhodoligotrophos defluvii]|uniref:sulfotransferase domain-containing protein n=1 Tax=Rhodoligotrophos defluvii TaxID=2561934 RepID=UPI0010C98640|nr:sulfotransferase domain-containing protein [Rhodoligotrophos defluvii]